MGPVIAIFGSLAIVGTTDTLNGAVEAFGGVYSNSTVEPITRFSLSNGLPGIRAIGDCFVENIT
jgi:hypothetical protein